MTTTHKLTTAQRQALQAIYEAQKAFIQRYHEGKDLRVSAPGTRLHHARVRHSLVSQALINNDPFGWGRAVLTAPGLRELGLSKAERREHMRDMADALRALVERAPHSAYTLEAFAKSYEAALAKLDAEAHGAGAEVVSRRDYGHEAEIEMRARSADRKHELLKRAFDALEAVQEATDQTLEELLADRCPTDVDQLLFDLDAEIHTRN